MIATLIKYSDFNY